MSQRYRQIAASELSGLGSPVVVGTFMRSGTHLTIDLIRRQFPAFQSWKRPLEPLDNLYFPVDVLLPGWEPANWTVERSLEVLRRPDRPILKTHFLDPDLTNLRRTQPAVADWLEAEATWIQVERDFRKVLMSLWAFLPEWEGKPPGELDEAWLTSQHQRWLKHGKNWQEMRPERIHLQFERIIDQTGTVLRALENALCETALMREPLLPRQLQSRTESRFRRIFGRGSESTAILCRTRPPRWKPEWESLFLPRDA